MWFLRFRQGLPGFECGPYNSGEGFLGLRREGGFAFGLDFHGAGEGEAEGAEAGHAGCTHEEGGPGM